MTERICCPFDSTPSAGGLILGGSAYVDVVSDPWDGMVCVLPLDESSEGTEGEFVDRSRNHFDGTGGKILTVDEDLDPTTLPTVDDGVFCLPSQHFDGRQLIHVDQDHMTGDHAFSISLWTKFETFYKSRTFYSRGYNDGANKYVVSFGHSFLNTLSISVRIIEDNGPPSEVLYFGGTTLSQGIWYHVAVTYDGTSLRLYLNGVLDGTKAVGGDLIALNNECFIATTDNASNIEGNIQEVHIFPAAMSANYLLAEHRAFCHYFVTEGETEYLFYS